MQIISEFGCCLMETLDTLHTLRDAFSTCACKISATPHACFIFYITSCESHFGGLFQKNAIPNKMGEKTTFKKPLFTGEFIQPLVRELFFHNAPEHALQKLLWSINKNKN